MPGAQSQALGDAGETRRKSKSSKYTVYSTASPGGRLACEGREATRVC